MTVFRNSLGKWVVYDGSQYSYYDSEEKAKQMDSYNDIGEESAEVEIAARLTKKILPDLRQSISNLLELEVMWYANGIPEMIASAKEAAKALEDAKAVVPASVVLVSVTDEVTKETTTELAVDPVDPVAPIGPIAPVEPTVVVGDTLIAGMDVSAWMAWEMVMASLKKWMNEPVGENMQSPMMILAKRYNRKV